MNKLNSKNWQVVRLNKANKTIKFMDRVFKTKAECDETIKSNQYISINLKAYNKLLSEGYSIYQEEVKSVSETIVTTVEPIEVEIINPEIEAQILKYTNEKIERDILAYKEKKRKENAVNLFLSTPPKQEKHKPLSFEKYALSDSQYEKNVKAVIGQRADYCNEVLNEDI